MLNKDSRKGTSEFNFRSNFIASCKMEHFNQKDPETKLIKFDLKCYFLQ